MGFQVRDYGPGDEQGWLRCRTLSFLGTSYFDVEVTDEVATIDTIAVHPDRQGRGIGTALLQHACDRMAALGVATVEAWTRDDEPTLRWYRSQGFRESDHYLHVYANYYTDEGEPVRAVAGRHDRLVPITAFLHAPLDLADEMRAAFGRVHVCRRFSQPLPRRRTEP